MLEKGAELDRFMKHLSHWTWVHFFYLYSEKHLLIADDFFLERVHSARKKPLVCKTSSASNYEDAITGDIEKILVFCQSGELQLVRRLQRKYPNITVTSGTYGYACVDASRKPKLVPFQAPGCETPAGQTVMLSTPYADAEFIAQSMAQNNMPHCHEYLGRPFAIWLKHHKNFQIARFFDGAMQSFGKDGKLPTLLQTDVLRSVFENTNFSLGKLLRHLKKINAKVIVVQREDKIMQAVTAQLLERTAERSVWTNRPKKKLGTPFQLSDLHHCLERYSGLQEDVSIIDQVIASGIQVHQVTLEAFISNQEESLNKVADFLEISLPKPASSLDYFSAYDNAQGVMPAAATFKRAMIDKAGLHVR